MNSLIRDIHLKALHSGPQLTLARLCEDFWLLRSRQTIRLVLHKCIACTRERAAVASELMGDLPDCRVRPVPRAFFHTGIDYAGPIQLRSTPWAQISQGLYSRLCVYDGESNSTRQ